MDRTKALSMRVVTLILVSTIIFCAVGTVHGKGKGALSEDAAYYHQLEAEYVSKARGIMSAEGYRNAGITMTHRVGETGGRTYIVRLHHERLEGIPKERESEIFAALTSIDFADGEVKFETKR